tara:strand:+ start:14552 stop:15031 length:480 start_codon:yes stop_codon:yes gene_type:complete
MSVLSNTGIRAGASGASAGGGDTWHTSEHTFSDDVSASAGYKTGSEAPNMFNGSTSGPCEPYDDSTVTWDAENGSSGALTVSSFRVYVVCGGSVDDSDFTVNGTNYGDAVVSALGNGTAGWFSLSGISTFNNSTWHHDSGAASTEVFAWESDGIILEDQ